VRKSGKDILLQVSRQIAHFRKADARYRGIRLPLKTWAQLGSVPVSSREDLVRFVQDYPLKDVFNVTATSGTTKDRLLIGHSKESYEVHVRRLVRLYRSVGISRKDLCLNLCSYGLNSGGRLMEVAYKAAGAGVIPLGILDHPGKRAEVVDLVKRLRPTVVNSYTNQLFDLFSAIGRKHSIRCCIVNGEPLSRVFKKRIEGLAGVRIFDHYGAMEVSGFAIAQKPDDDFMKVFDDGLLLEVLTEDGDVACEGRGALLVSDLLNRCMPFIRYKLGDEVELLRRRGGLFVKVFGRLSDTVLLDGEVYSSREVVRTTQDLLGHPQFFFVVEKDLTTYRDVIILNVLSSAPALRSDLRQKLEGALSLERMIDIRTYRGEVPKTSTGKYRQLIDARTKKNNP